MKNNRVFKLIVSFLLGGLTGAIFPLLFIFLDLDELKMDITLRNISWVINSQNLITFSVFALPIVFGFIFILFMLNIEKNKEIKTASAQMANMAHAAGMGEIAAEVIHNIGNVLTSVFASAEKSLAIINGSKYGTAVDAEKIFDEKKELLTEVYKKDKKIEQLMNYYVYYAKTTIQEVELIKEEITKLKLKLDIIRDILMTQKSYVYSKAFKEKSDIHKLIDASMEIFQEKLLKLKIASDIRLDKNIEINTETGKVVNILSNLIKNAIEAMEYSDQKYIEITSENSEKWVKISVRDSGPGIKDDVKKKIFNYGHTTKKKGAGLGLHSCYNLANSLNGKFEVEDPQSGPGVIFSLSLPKS